MNRNYSRLNRSNQSLILSWMRLVRLPNLFTAIGDPLAGIGLAAVITGLAIPTGKLIFLPLCSVLLYAFGVILNDWHDMAEDRRHNPDRPLVSGEIQPTIALLAGIVALLCALFIALLAGQMSFIIALCLAAVIIAYNLLLKQYTSRGAVCMGFCRALNMLIGASAIQITGTLALPMLTIMLYITYVTILADDENRRIQIAKENVFYPVLIYIVGWGLSMFFLEIPHFNESFRLGLLCALAGIVASFLPAVAIYNRSVNSTEMHKFIGRLITAIIPMQAAWAILGFPEHAIAIVLIALAVWLLTAMTSKFIMQS